MQTFQHDFSKYFHSVAPQLSLQRMLSCYASCIFLHAKIKVEHIRVKDCLLQNSALALICFASFSPFLKFCLQKHVS